MKPTDVCSCGHTAEDHADPDPYELAVALDDRRPCQMCDCLDVDVHDDSSAWDRTR